MGKSLISSQGAIKTTSEEEEATPIV